MQTALTQTSTASAPAQPFSESLPGRIVLGLGATVVVALAAHVSFPLPFTPVPLTLQPLAVLGVGLALGPVTGFAAMLAYLAEGAMGLPVFSPTGPGGVLQIIGPTGGFLMSYPLVAAVSGGVTRAVAPKAPRFAAAALGCTLAVALLFCLGAAWFMHYTGNSLNVAWTGAVAPFLPGEAVKVLIASGIYAALARRTRT